MKSLIAFLILTLSFCAFAQDKDQKPATLRSVLLDQLRTTHNAKDWFVDANTAVAGITAEQASWTDKAGNHSVGQLANHLVFWNTRALAEFKGEPVSKFSGNNDETFNAFDAKKWADTQHALDQVMIDWEKAVEAADDQKLAKAAPTIARIGTHNAYHVGQIVIIRKEQGSWDPDKGVK